MSTADTIFALSSGAGRAGVAVFRLSGPTAIAVAARLAGRDLPARRAVLATLRDPAEGADLDRGLVLAFPAPASFTGEDVAELQVHGGPAVVAALARVLAAEPGLRPAEPGEFTRRAFEAGKLDLTEVEGLADLIAAETEAQRRQALRQMSGALGALYGGWRVRLVAALAHLEASIDFADEELPADILDPVFTAFDALGREIAAHLADAGRGERLRAGLSAVLLGAPNAGKSSLLNRLARRDVAIVSTEAGTTRDVIEVQLDLAGIPLTLADTAGLREAGGEIEAEGRRRAQARAEAADLRLWVVDAGAAPALPPAFAKGDVLILNKIDLPNAVAALPALETAARAAGGEALAVSARSGEGLVSLESRLAARAEALAGAGEAPALTPARHRCLLEETVAHLAAAARPGPVELVAEEGRLAARALGRLTGRVDVEDLLDVIFADFCLGK